MDVSKMFSFTIKDAKRVIEDFHSEMRLGLEGKNSSLKMIPSFVGRATGKESGRFLSLDLGGTNLRVLAVDLDGRGGINVVSVSKFVIEKNVMTGRGDKLFDFIALSIRDFLLKNSIDAKEHYDLAFTFSFPVEQSSIASGSLIVWTKGFSAAGVEGKDVVALLSEALSRAGLSNISVVALANDTVGTLAAKGYSDSACDMGVILGTGTNACYPERIENIGKLKCAGRVREMIINMEWGNFSRLRLNEFDKELDKASNNPGRQYLEKMVSGMYLGELVRRVALDAGLKTFSETFAGPYSFDTEEMSAVAEGRSKIAGLSPNDAAALADICAAVSTRSARIAGTAIAAVVSWMDAGLNSKHVIGIDGSLFEKYPGFSDNIKMMLKEIFGSSAGNIRPEMAKDGSGTGSAVIAAIAALN